MQTLKRGKKNFLLIVRDLQNGKMKQIKQLLIEKTLKIKIIGY